MSGQFKSARNNMADMPPPENPELLNSFALSAFDRQPFVKAFFAIYMFAVFFGYPAIIALALSEQWRWLPLWFEAWNPIVGALRKIILLFDNFERELVGAGFAGRVSVIHHLIAVEWFMLLSVLVSASVLVLRLSHSDWARSATAAPIYRIVLLLLVSVAAFVAGGYWIFIGFNLVPLSVSYELFFEWQKYDSALVGIGFFFWCVAAGWIFSLLMFGSLLARGRSQ